MLFLLFGSSASGKTTVIHDVRGLVPNIEVHDFDEIDVLPGADTAWRQRAYGYWIETALALESQGTDLVLCGQTPLGELLASPSPPKLEAISACLVDCDDMTRGLRLEDRGEEWFARSAARRRATTNCQKVEYVEGIGVLVTLHREGSQCSGRRLSAVRVACSCPHRSPLCCRPRSG